MIVVQRKYRTLIAFAMFVGAMACCGAALALGKRDVPRSLCLIVVYLSLMSAFFFGWAASAALRLQAVDVSVGRLLKLRLQWRGLLVSGSVAVSGAAMSLLVLTYSSVTGRLPFGMSVTSLIWALGGYLFAACAAGLVWAIVQRAYSPEFRRVREAERLEKEGHTLCAACGYVVDGLAAGARCPECGTPVGQRPVGDRQQRQ